MTGFFNLLINNKIHLVDNIICIINGIFARNKAHYIDTMRGRLMLAWYQRARTTCALEQPGNLRLHQHGIELLSAIRTVRFT